MGMTLVLIVVILAESLNGLVIIPGELLDKSMLPFCCMYTRTSPFGEPIMLVE